MQHLVGGPRIPKETFGQEALPYGRILMDGFSITTKYCSHRGYESRKGEDTPAREKSRREKSRGNTEGNLPHATT